MTIWNPDRKLTTDEGARTYNIGFAKWRVQCFCYILAQGSSSVLQLNISAENTPFRKALNRYGQVK